MVSDADHLSALLARLETGALNPADRQLLSRLVHERLAALETVPRTSEQGELDTGQLLTSLELRIAEQEALRQVSLNLAASLDLQTVLKAVLQGTLHLVRNVSDAHIFLYENDRLTFGAAQWADGRKSAAWTMPRPRGLTYSVARQGEIIHVPDMTAHYLFENTGWEGAIIGIPLKIGTRVVGVMTVGREHPAAFSGDDIRLLQLLADHAAISIENARQHNLAYLQAHLDSLTSLPNRRAMDERLQFECQHALSAQLPFAFLMTDLDQFKAINDTYGHLIGDHVLHEIAACMQATIRDKDFLARYGGDEIALILPDTGHDMAVTIAQRIQEAIAGLPLGLPGAPEQRVSISIGLAVFPLDAGSWLDLIESADEMLYQAKQYNTGGLVSTHGRQSPAASPHRSST